MINQSIDLYFFTLKPTQFPLVFLSLLALYVIFTMSRYIFGELKTALRETKKDRVVIYLSGLIFSVFASVAIIFIIALVISSFAINTIFGLQETKLIYIDAMAKPWQYVLFIPLGFILLISFVFIYQIMDYLRIASPMNEGVMRIQKTIEQKLIKRVRAPWSYFIALVFLIIVMGVIPFLLYFMIKNQQLLSPFNYSLSDEWLLAMIFIPYLMLFPIFYLAYYSTVGNAQLLFLGSKLIGSRKTWGKNKLRIWIIYFFIALISLISEINTIVEMIPYLLTGELPEVTTSYKDVGRGFLAQTIEFIIKSIPGTTPQILERFYLFTAIIPLDFVLFALTTVLFALYGFRNEFLRRENLNTPKMVIFAAFILCGVSFSIFLNVITTWPWVIPDEILPFELSDPNQQRIVLFFFYPATLVEQIFTIGFLIYNLFFNKELQNSATHNILEKATMEKNLVVIEKYVQHANTEIKTYISSVLDGILSDIEEEPEKLKIFVRILEKILKDPDGQIAEPGNAVLEKLVLNFPENEWESLITCLFTDNKVSQMILDGIGMKFTQFHEAQLPKLKRVVDILIKADLSARGETVLISIIQSVAEKTESYAINITLPLLSSPSSALCRGGLVIIKELIRDFKPIYPELYKQIAELIKSPDEDTQLKAIGVLGAMSAMDDLYLGQFKALMQKIGSSVGYKIKQQIIGSIAQIIVTNSSLFGQLFPQIMPYFNDADEKIHKDLAISIGIIISSIPKQEYFEKVHIFVLNLSKNLNEEVKRALLQSLLLIIKVRHEYALDTKFLETLLPYFERFNEDDLENILTSLSQVGPESFISFIELISNAFLQENLHFDTKAFNQLLTYIDQNYNELVYHLERSPGISYLIKIAYKHPNSFSSLSRLLVTLSQKSDLIFLQSFLFLERVITDHKDSIVAPIITLYGTFALNQRSASDKKFLQLPKSLPPFLNTSEHQKELQGLQEQISQSLQIPTLLPRFIAFIDKDCPLTVANILTFLTSLEEIDLESQKTIILKLKPLFSKNNDALLPIIRYLFTPPSVDPNTVQKLQPKVLSTMLGYLQRVDQPPMQEVAKTINFLIRNSQQWPKLPKYLIKFIQKAKNYECQAVCLISLSKFPGVINNSDYMQILFSNIYHKQTTVRLTALRTIGLILRDAIIADQKSDNGNNPEMKVSKFLTRFADYALLSDPEDEVRIEFISQISQIVQIYPHFPPLLIILNQAVHDKKQNLAITSVQSLFRSLGENPKNIRVILNSLQHIFKNTSVSVRMEGIQQCIRLLKKSLSSEIQHSLYQMLISFASDEDSKIRAKVILQIQKYLNTQNADFLNNLEYLLLNLRSTVPFVNRDHFKIIQTILENFSELKLSNNQQSLLFREIIRINQYSDIPLKRNIVKHIEKIINLYPKKVPQILGMIYILLQSRDNIVVASLRDPLFVIVRINPKFQKEIVKNLNKMLTESVHREISKLKDALTLKK